MNGKPTHTRHLAASPWGNTDVAMCGARRSAGVGIVKGRRQATCAECIARKLAQIERGANVRPVNLR